MSERVAVPPSECLATAWCWGNGCQKGRSSLLGREAAMREMPCPVIPPLPDPKRLCKCAVSSSGAGVEGTNKGVLHPHVQHESTASAEMGAVSWELYLHHPTNHHRSLACRPRQTLPNILHTQHMLSQPPLPLNAILNWTGNIHRQWMPWPGKY